MSSSTASPSSSAPSSTYTSDDSGLGTTSTNSQLPFSFLLAFVSIFIFLVACGFGTRRLSTQLQRTMMNAACQCIRQPPVPGLYDVCPKREKCVSRYCDLLPLSVSYVREEMDTDAPLSSIANFPKNF
ncbi:hypothetical protein C8Q72DRAFT_151387 [Fomitopsis betulina]|nr:hypothetical protein C8Q72DRAFT_151387 [Fomitopsis betulina]